MDFRHPVADVIPGAQGHILQALALACACGVSAAQTYRVMPGLASLGLVEPREVPPSALFRVKRGAALWRKIEREGVVLAGRALSELR